MPSANPDLARLAALAGDDPSRRPVNDGVEALILRVQADLFATAPRRNGETVAAFEALALGFLPKASPRTAAHVAWRVAGIPETPQTVLDALLARGGEPAAIAIENAIHLSESALAAALDAEPLLACAVARRAHLPPGTVERLLRKGDRTVDRALAENGASVLHGRALFELVRRARSDGPLAQALLRRPDLPAAEAAVLYLQADAARREEIRARLSEGMGASAPTVMRRVPPETVAGLLEAAAREDVGGFEARLSSALGLDAGAPPWRFSSPDRADLLALALVAGGIAEEDCVRIFLTLSPDIARSVPIVFGLVAIVRSTPRSTAARLVEAILQAPLFVSARGRLSPVAEDQASSRLPAFARTARQSAQREERRDRA